MLRVSVLAAFAVCGALADLRSLIYSAIESRSGAPANCSAFAAMFTAQGVYESPVGSGPVVGPAAIRATCHTWNANIDPVLGQVGAQDKKLRKHATQRSPVLYTGVVPSQFFQLD